MKVIDINGPHLPESIANAEFKQWLVPTNQKVELGETIAIIESEKIAFEIVAPDDGFLSELMVSKDGEIVLSDQLIARFTVLEADDELPENVTEKSSTEQEVELTVPVVKSESNQQELKVEKAEQVEKEEQVQNKSTETNFISTGRPVSGWGVQSTVQDELQDTSRTTIKPSNDTCVPRTDLLQDVKYYSPKARRIINEFGEDSEHLIEYLKNRVPNNTRFPGVFSNSASQYKRESDYREILSPARKLIADTLVDKNTNSVILTAVNEVNFEKIVKIVKVYGENFKARHSLELTASSFVVKAVAEALKSFPILTVHREQDELVFPGNIDVAVALHSNRGIVTPVIKNANCKSLAEVETELLELKIKSSKGSLALDDMLGSCFTITDNGAQGALCTTPLVNTPQVASLALNEIIYRPVVENEQVVVRPMMYLSIAYDCCLVDEISAIQFLNLVKELLEDPTALLLHA